MAIMERIEGRGETQEEEHKNMTTLRTRLFFGFFDFLKAEEENHEEIFW